MSLNQIKKISALKIEETEKFLGKLQSEYKYLAPIEIVRGLQRLEEATK
jgi:hypothetical protein